MTGNTASWFGGGIELWHGASATLMDDTITGNTVSHAAGQSDGGGGGIAVNNDASPAATLTIRDTVISGNEVDAGSGTGNGGGIDVFNTSGTGPDPNLTIDIDHSTVNGNEINGALGEGAGIAALDGSWLVTDSTVAANAGTPGTQVGGGGVFVSTAGFGASLDSTWSDDTIAGNQAYDGAGLQLAGGNTTLTNDTVSGNTASDAGGGIDDETAGAGATSATFDTIADNTAGTANGGGNLDVHSADTLDLGESIVAAGVAGASRANCVASGGALQSGGYNLIDDATCGLPATGDIIGRSAQLAALAANGGPTQTQLPASTSPAVGAVPSAVTSGTVVGTDQRGDSRGQGLSGSSSAGSVEVAQDPPTPPPPAPAHGYWLVGSDGGIFAFGSSQFYGSTGNLRLQRPVVGISPTLERGGYWLVASDGGVFAYGDAGFVGSIPGLGLHPAGSGQPNSLNAPIVGMVPSHDGGGYFMVAADGGVFAFGDAHFAGSCPGIGGCSGAAVAVMPDASGNGYWVVTNTGNVYGFGDAAYDGSPGHGTVTSAVAAPDGSGLLGPAQQRAGLRLRRARPTWAPRRRAASMRSTPPTPSSPPPTAAATGCPRRRAPCTPSVTPRTTGPWPAAT